MWSVWSNSTDIYISPSCSMLQVKGRQAITLNYPATLPIDKVLALIGEAFQTHNIKLSTTKLRLVVGSQICPPINFLAPLGVRSDQELQLLANAAAAQNLGLAARDVLCEWSASSSSIIAALPVWWVQSLRSWARSENAKIVSIKPTWSWATQCAAAQKNHIHCLWLAEQDVVSVLCNPGKHNISSPATAPNCVRLSSAEEAQAWALAKGYGPEAILKIRFDLVATTESNGMPSVFKRHWSIN